MNKVTIYVRETGHDADGDGLTVETAYRSRARATMDIPVKFHPDHQYEIDTMGATEEGDSIDVELASLLTHAGDIWRLFRKHGTGLFWICKNACEDVAGIGSKTSDGKIVDGTNKALAEQLLREYVSLAVSKGQKGQKTSSQEDLEAARFFLKETPLSTLLADAAFALIARREMTPPARSALYAEIERFLRETLGECAVCGAIGSHGKNYDQFTDSERLSHQVQAER